MKEHLILYYSQIQNLLAELIIHLIRNLSTAPSHMIIPEKIKDEMRTKLIDDFLDKYDEDLKLHDLGEQLHLSTKQTNRILKKYYGSSFKQKQLITRIQIAMDLLPLYTPDRNSLNKVLLCDDKYD